MPIDKHYQYNPRITLRAHDIDIEGGLAAMERGLRRWLQKDNSVDADGAVKAARWMMAVFMTAAPHLNLADHTLNELTDLVNCAAVELAEQGAPKVELDAAVRYVTALVLSVWQSHIAEAVTAFKDGSAYRERDRQIKQEWGKEPPYSRWDRLLEAIMGQRG